MHEPLPTVTPNDHEMTVHYIKPAHLSVTLNLCSVTRWNELLFNPHVLPHLSQNTSVLRLLTLTQTSIT